MKTVSKILTLGTLMGAFVFASAAPTFAQGTEKDQMYEKFLACYKATDKTQRDACYADAKTFLDKYEKDNDEYTKFVRGRYDKYQAIVKQEGDQKDNDRFNNAVKAQPPNAEEAFAAGKVILARSPELGVDVPIVLASIGFDKAFAKAPDTKFDNEAINQAKMAIQALEAGKPSVTGSYGAFAYSYQTKDFPDGKANALGYMNYGIGFIMYNRLNQKKEALPYFYKATQYNSGAKNDPVLYQTIGSWYLDEFRKMDAARIAKTIDAAKEEAKTAGKTQAEIDAIKDGKDTPETVDMLAMEKGLAERATEAYIRAYKVTNNEPVNKTYKDGLLTRAKELYAVRFKDTATFDAYVSGLASKPFTDPSTPVTPVVETAPASGQTSSAMTMSADTSTTTTKPATTPAGSTTKPGTTPAKTTTTPAKTTTTPAKTPAKTPAPKKPGNR